MCQYMPYHDGHETEQDPVGSQKPSCVPHFLFLGNGPRSASTAFPEFQGAGSGSCWSRKGGVAKTREERSSNNSSASGQDSGSPSRDTHNNVSVLYTQEKSYTPYASFRNQYSKT